MSDDVEMECCRGCRGSGWLVRNKMVVGPMTRRAAQVGRLVAPGGDPADVLLGPREAGAAYVRFPCWRCLGYGYARTTPVAGEVLGPDMS